MLECREHTFITTFTSHTAMVILTGFLIGITIGIQDDGSLKETRAIVLNICTVLLDLPVTSVSYIM